MPKKLSILVAGSTGKQGGAVARLLLEKGHHVRALTRKAESVAAKALAARGAEIVTGSLDDRASLDRALAGTDAVFAMTTPFEAGVEAEARQGITTVDAAKAAGAFLVFTSVGSANRATGIPHFDSKFEVEQHIAKVRAPAAILAPVYFMDNAVAFTRDQLRAGVFATPLAPKTKLAQIAIEDIAACAVEAFENRDRFEGKRYDLAGDELTGEQATVILSRVTGKAFSYFAVPMEIIRAQMGEDGAKMYEWFERTGYAFDRAALASAFPRVRWHSFEGWAKKQDWKGIFAV